MKHLFFLLALLGYFNLSAQTTNLLLGTASCGACNAEGHIYASGLSYPLTYNWSSGQTTAHVSGLCAGTYTVTVTGNNGDSITATDVVNGTSGIHIDAMYINDDECVTCQGSILLQYGYGASYNVDLWNGTQSGVYQTNQIYLCADTYSITITDPNVVGCDTVLSIEVEDFGNAPLTIMDTVFAGSSTTACDWNIGASHLGGTPPYTINRQQTEPVNTSLTSFSNLCVGVYTYHVQDSNNCGAFKQFNLVDSILAQIDISNQCSSSSTLTASAQGYYPPFSYQWSNGGSGSSITVNTSGTYSVTITDSDTIPNQIVVVSDYVIINPPIVVTSTVSVPSCVSCCDGSASAIVTGGSGGYAYSWSSGGSGSTETNLCAGTYTVTVTDSAGCSEVEVIGVSDGTCYMVYGHILQGDHSKVYLIEENNGYLSLIDSMQVDTAGNFSFLGICNGAYYLKGELLTSHSAYSNYIPTYFDSAALWSNATMVVVNNANQNIDFSLLPGANSGAPGFIGGYINAGANRAEGDPVVNVLVVAYNQSGKVAASSRTDINGHYALSGLMDGTYQVYADILNKSCYAHEVTLEGEFNSVDDRDFEVFGTEIRPIQPSAIDPLHEAKVQIYPNPVLNTLTILTDEQISGIGIFDVAGKMVMNKTTISNKTLDIQHLETGLYYLSVQTSTGSSQVKFIKL